MTGVARALALTSAIFLLATAPALAQKNGGVLKFFHRDSPASGSIHGGDDLGRGALHGGFQ